MNISEDEKRWVVIGIAFNKLVPHIRPFVERSLQAEYQSLKFSHNIHCQTPPGILKNHPKHLKYENINSNSSHKLSPFKFDFSKFDYKVSSHVDFAKLYLQPFMTKFNAFDGECDGSAVLLLLGEVPVFSPAIQSSAKTVRDHVRNEWAHCNSTDWDEVKFRSCFKEMQQLVQSLGLPIADETKILSELSDWENKGNLICFLSIFLSKSQFCCKNLKTLALFHCYSPFTINEYFFKEEICLRTEHFKVFFVRSRSNWNLEMSVINLNL